MELFALILLVAILLVVNIASFCIFYFQKVVDYLKMDIERSEWDSLPSMMADGILNKVKQFGVEIHLGSVTGLRSRLNLLQRLEKIGFRKWYSHKNPACIRQSKYRKVAIAKCIEMVYINTNFLV